MRARLLQTKHPARVVRALLEDLRSPDPKHRAIDLDGSEVAFLIDLWNTCGQDHDDTPDILVLADWIIAHTSTAEEIAELPYAIGNWCGSWHQVGRRAALACDRIACAALARDPECESALWLYAQEDFLARVKRKGPPLAPPPIDAQIEKVRRIVRLFEEDRVHPLDIPSIDTIAVTTSAIVDVLLEELERTPSWRARNALVSALGRATVDCDRVARAFARVLESGRCVDEISMAIHYDMKDRDEGVIEPMIAIARKTLDDLTSEDLDYRHQWPLRTLLGLFRRTRDARIRTFLEEVLRACPAMPAWKRAKMFELESEAPRVLRKRIKAA